MTKTRNMSSKGLLIDQTPHACPYIEGQTAVLPTRWYADDISGPAFDVLLSESDRRVGRTLYRPTCPDCSACEAIRLPIRGLRLSRSQLRCWKRNSDLRVTVGRPIVDDARLDLFNRHKLERGLSKESTSASHYANWLAVSCVETVETRYWLDDELIAVGILDVGSKSASSVYFYFDPDHAKRGLGTYSVLADCAWLRDKGLEYYYLGLYVGECSHMSYKARFLPHERRVKGRWVQFAAPYPKQS